MPLTFTPGQLKRRAEMYYQLAQMTAAGIPIPAALEHLARNPPDRAYRTPLMNLVRNLGEGCTFSDALTQEGNWTSGFEQSLLYAGEQSGRLDACFRLLADYFADRARVASQILTDLAYPAFLYHLAVLVFSFVSFVAGGAWISFAFQVLALTLPLYILIFAGMYASQSAHGEKWRSMIEKAVAPVPILGDARRQLALARLSAALEALLSAGVTIIEAWELAGAACGSPELRRTVNAWRPLLDAGQTPAEVVVASGRFPELFSSQYTTGEISGQLDETLKRLHRYYQEEGTRKLHAFAQWTPRLVYLGVLIGIGFLVVRWWMGYFNMVKAAGGF